MYCCSMMNSRRNTLYTVSYNLLKHSISSLNGILFYQYYP